MLCDVNALSPAHHLRRWPLREISLSLSIPLSLPLSLSPSLARLMVHAFGQVDSSCLIYRPPMYGYQFPMEEGSLEAGFRTCTCRQCLSRISSSEILARMAKELQWWVIWLYWQPICQRTNWQLFVSVTPSTSSVLPCQYIFKDFFMNNQPNLQVATCSSSN